MNSLYILSLITLGLIVAPVTAKIVRGRFSRLRPSSTPGACAGESSPPRKDSPAPHQYPVMP